LLEGNRGILSQQNSVPGVAKGRWGETSRDQLYGEKTLLKGRGGEVNVQTPSTGEWLGHITKKLPGGDAPTKIGTEGCERGRASG